MFFGGDDDDADFTPSGSSRLASLFTVDQPPQKVNKSLTYTAPKQPKKGRHDSSSSTGQSSQQETEVPQLTLLFAVAVHTYKLEDGKYVSVGKLGAAVLGNHGSSVYQLLLYKGKQQQVSKAKITQNFSFVVQAHNYANFYDDQQQNWSVMFDSDEAAKNFAKQMALAKANSAGSKLETVIIQDLVPGEGSSLEIGDSAEIKYTGWLLTANSIGQKFDSNTSADKLLRVKLGRGKVVKGLEEGLLGANKGCKRLLIIPSSLGYGAQGHSNIPAHATIVFEVEVVKLKVAKDKEVNLETSCADIQVILPQVGEQVDTAKKERSESTADESTIKARGASISEALTCSPKSDKAKIISRMAKMGQPMLPLHGAVVAQPSDDSDIEDEVMFTTVQPPQAASASSSQAELTPSPQTTKPKPKSRTHIPVHQPASVSQPQSQSPVTVQQSKYTPHQVSVYQPPVPWQQIQQMMPNTATAYGLQHGPIEGVFPGPQATALSTQPVSIQVPTVGTPTSVMETHIPILLSESRSQNMEMRIAVGKVSDKLDQVLSKLDQHQQMQAFQQPGNMMPFPYNIGSPSTSLASQQLDPVVVMTSIQKIMQENENLKLEIKDKNEKIEIQNEKISQLLQRSQRFLEESNTMLQQRSDSLHSSSAQSQARILALEEEKCKITAELSDALGKVSSLQMEMNSQQQKQGELKIQLSASQQQVERLRHDLQHIQEHGQESDSSITNLEQNLQEARLSQKAQEEKVRLLDEKLTELRTMNESLERKLSERKQELMEEQRQGETKLKELREYHATEIEELKSKLLKPTLPPEGSTEQLTQLENELNEQWQKKLEKQLSDVIEKHWQEIKDLNEDKAMLHRKLEELEASDIGVWKNKCKHMKEKEEEREAKLQEVQNSMQELKNQYEARMSVLASKLKTDEQSDLGRQTKTEIVNEVKRVMNSVYQTLQPEFDPGETYLGEEIRKTLLTVIRTVTLKLLEKHEEEAQAQVEVKNGTSESANDFDTQQIQTKSSAEGSVEQDSEFQSIEQSTITAPLNDVENKNMCQEKTEFSATLSGVQEEENSSRPACGPSVQDNSECQSEISKKEQDGKGSTEEEQTESAEKKDDENKEHILRNEVKENQKEEKGEHEKISTVIQNSNKSSRDSSMERDWKPQPPPLPLFDDDDDEDDDWMR